MRKSQVLVTLALITATAMFFIGITPTHIAKASTCSASTSHMSITTSKSGSCSSSASGSQVHQGVSVIGGSKSSCASRSDAQRPGIGFFDSERFSSNGAVSCSSHSP